MTREQNRQNFLSAQWGRRRVTIGIDPPDQLRLLSDQRQLTCPGCGANLVLHAGTVRTHHFAHLAGTICTAPQSEPETEEHREGKVLLAQWLQRILPQGPSSSPNVILEAHIPETRQRADILILLPQEGSALPQRIALEYQCAALSAKDWRRRHRLYRDAGISDLWILGGSRLIHETLPKTPPGMGTSERMVHLRTTELERALLWDGAPLLFLDAVGIHLPATTLARFRPEANAQALRPVGQLRGKPLLPLPFPFALLDWPHRLHPDSPQPVSSISISISMPMQGAGPNGNRRGDRSDQGSEALLWNWLEQRHRVTATTLPGFFGLPVTRVDVFACEARAWQAAIYYRFVHCRVGDRWWLNEVESWARAYLPLRHPVSLPRLHASLAEYQEMLCAAGMLSLPRGYNRANASVTDDLTTLASPPDSEEVLRLARYRKTLSRPG